MRDAAIKENVNKIKELQSQYPSKIRILRSELDVSSINMDAVMKGGTKDFDNADPNMPAFLADQLGEGKQIAILPAGKSKLLFMTGKNIF